MPQPWALCPVRCVAPPFFSMCEDTHLWANTPTDAKAMSVMLSEMRSSPHPCSVRRCTFCGRIRPQMPRQWASCPALKSVWDIISRRECPYLNDKMLPRTLTAGDDFADTYHGERELFTRHFSGITKFSNLSHFRPLKKVWVDSPTAVRDRVKEVRDVLVWVSMV